MCNTGYIYSGAIASFAYHYLAAHGFADSFIILGPNHTGAGSGVSIMTKGSWETPLGTIPINMGLAQQIHTGIVVMNTASKYSFRSCSMLQKKKSLILYQYL